MKEQYIIWKDQAGVGKVGERFVMNEDGDYVGLMTGDKYDKISHNHSENIWAKVRSIDKDQLNGMIHLDPGAEECKENISKKEAFIGCIMPFRKAHLYGPLQCYQCIWTGEYYNQNELEVLMDDDND